MQEQVDRLAFGDIPFGGECQRIDPEQSPVIPGPDEVFQLEMSRGLQVRTVSRAARRSSNSGSLILGSIILASVYVIQMVDFQSLAVGEGLDRT